MNISEIRALTIDEMLRELKYAPEEITPNTYLYIGQDGQLQGMEKRDRRSRPDDELDGIGYVYAYDRLDNVLTPAEIEREFGLQPGTVRMAIRKKRIPARKADDRTWLVLRADAERRWGRNLVRPT